MQKYQEFIDKNGRKVKRKNKKINFDYAITIKVNKQSFENFKSKTGKNYGKILREFMNSYKGE